MRCFFYESNHCSIIKLYLRRTHMRSVQQATMKTAKTERRKEKINNAASLCLCGYFLITCLLCIVNTVPGH